MISVIIPIYNVYNYIDICLESVVGQTWSEFEILLIDDGSTDGSDLLCQKWAEYDQRVHLVRKENEGLGSARNLGVELARYEYITFLDSDDWWDKHYLEQMLGPVLKTAPDIVCCDIHYWEKDESGNIADTISELRMEPQKRLVISENRELINTARTFMWGKIYKKKLFTENEIVQPPHIYEDVAVTPFIIAKADSIYRVDQPLYYYRRKRQGSLANSVAGLWDMKLSLQEVMLKFVNEGIFEQYKKQLRKLIYSQVRFIVKKAKVLCDTDVCSAIERVFWDVFGNYFPEVGELGKGTFWVEGRRELKEALQKIVIEERQIADYREGMEKKAEWASKGGIVLEIPDAGRIFLVLPSKGKWEYRKVQLDMIPFEEKSGEEQLWNMADEIFYAL